MNELRFTDEVALVTGSSRGLGAAFARCIADAGATVVINSTGASNRGDQLVSEIEDAGGRALHVPGDVADAANLIGRITDQCHRIDAIVHNAGFVRDKTLRKMSESQWDEVMEVHLKAAFRLTQSAWPHFESQGAGRLVFISSASGLYGNFGQGNYAAAKAGMHGLARTIALEGAQLNIHCNVVAPFGATELNSGNMDQAMKDLIKPDYIAPLIGYLAHPRCEENGGLFEASAGAFKKVRWERSRGLRLDPSADMSIGDIAAGWDQVVRFDHTEHPNEMRESLRMMYAPEPD